MLSSNSRLGIDNVWRKEVIFAKPPKLDDFFYFQHSRHHFERQMLRNDSLKIGPEGLKASVFSNERLEDVLAPLLSAILSQIRRVV